MNRLRENFVYVKNPFNTKQISKILLIPEHIDCIVFWTKNAEKLMPYLPEIDDMGYKYYFQFTLTSYDSSIERGVPKKAIIIDTFKRLSEQIGKDKVIWRYDPIFLTDKHDLSYHIKWYEYLADQLKDHTEKCVFSFIDMYKKCEKNLKNIQIDPLSKNDKEFLVKNLSAIANAYSMKLESCAQEESFEQFGVYHGKCIDDKLISNITKNEMVLEKDKNQREQCGCVTSVDIGTYNTCKNFCKYCYANYSEKTASKNTELHDPNSPLISGHPTGEEKITERKVIKNKSVQLGLFHNNNAQKANSADAKSRAAD
jgi:hypothetical protein